MKVKEIKQIGIVVGGISTINLWGGGCGSIEMDGTFIPNQKISKTTILNSVNDGGFGCESIKSAEIDIFIKYDNGSIEYDRTLFTDNKIHTSQFLKY